ncbi:uncharacterized protein [Cherax quadricarinatus]
MSTGTSLSSSSGGESNSGFLESPESPTPGSPLFSPQLEDRLRHSVSCFRRLLRSSSRAHTATSLSYRIRHSRYCGCSSGHSIDNIEMVDAKVMYASSQDPTFPPSAMLDGRPDTFWASSGLFPQVVVLTLPGLTSVDSLTILAYNVRKVSVARSIKTQPTDFEEVVQTELPHDEGKLQNSVLSSDQITAAHLRITIVEGHDHFCSVHKVSVAGSVGQGYGADHPAPNLTKVKTEHPPAVPNPPVQQRPRSPVQVDPKADSLSVVDDDEDEEEETEVLPPTTYIQEMVEDIGDDEDF